MIRSIRSQGRPPVSHFDIMSIHIGGGALMEKLSQVRATVLVEALAPDSPAAVQREVQRAIDYVAGRWSCDSSLLRLQPLPIADLSKPMPDPERELHWIRIRRCIWTLRTEYHATIVDISDSTICECS